MRQPINNRRRGVPAVLWSEILALWRAGARRPALPLFLAMLLWVAAPFTAQAECSLEMGGHRHETAEAHHHVEEAGHYDSHAAPQAGGAHSARLQAPASCCSCSSEPIDATVAVLFAPHHSHADGHALVYTAIEALPVYRFDALEGLHTRAGPPTGKPQLLSLASLTGRAPPVSL